MPDVLIYADSIRSPELRHEVPLTIGDPFLYAERNGERHVLTNVLEVAKFRELGGLEPHLPEEFGFDELIAEGRAPKDLRNELLLRACRSFGIEKAVVPFWFPLSLADFLRENGISVRADEEFFDERRRVKNDGELAGIRRAQKAAEAGMAAGRDMLRGAQANGSAVTLDGEPLTVERIKAVLERTFSEHDCAADEFIVAPGPQGASGHDMGSGPIVPDVPIVFDLWPRDRASGCYADMTRTFVVGTPSDELVEWQGLCLQALERAVSEIRPGVAGKNVYDGTCDIFEQAGYPTQRTKTPGQTLDEGFFHGLGHGVGLEVHEQPGLGLISDKELVAGDVLTVEPGLYRQGYGGCRLEDLVLVTEDGAENLTDFPYDLKPDA